MRAHLEAIAIAVDRLASNGHIRPDGDQDLATLRVALDQARAELPTETAAEPA